VGLPMTDAPYNKNCSECKAAITMRKTVAGWRPFNSDNTPHKCGTGGKGGVPPGGFVARLEDYTQGSAEFTVEGGKKKTYAITVPMQKEWASKEFLMPALNHPDVWLRIAIDSKNFIQTYQPDSKPAWAGNLSDPTGGTVTPVTTPHEQQPTTPPKQDTRTSPVTEPEPEKDVWGEEREEFCALLTATGREGMPALLQHLIEETDFLIAPSSTKYHDACEGGLLHHSVKVYHNLVALAQMFEIEIPPDTSLPIIALLHDLCKVNIYKKERKSLPRRDENTGELVFDDWGKKIWDEQIVYTVDDQMPLGHGEKSVIMIQRYIQLTDTEIFAIRWHMMAYDDSRNSYAGNLAITNASDKYRIIPLFHMADLGASFLELRKPTEVRQ